MGQNNLKTLQIYSVTDMSTKDHSSLQESNIANYLGWQVVSGSGSRLCRPGDIISDEWLGECKTHITKDNKLVFLMNVWDKIREEAVSQYKCPALFVDDGSKQIDKTWVMFSTNINPFMTFVCNMIDQKIGASLRFDHWSMICNCTNVLGIQFNCNKNICVTTLPKFKQLLEEY